MQVISQISATGILAEKCAKKMILTKNDSNQQSLQARFCIYSATFQDGTREKSNRDKKIHYPSQKGP